MGQKIVSTYMQGPGCWSRICESPVVATAGRFLGLWRSRARDLQLCSLVLAWHWKRRHPGA